MRTRLKPHPDWPSPAIDIEVDVARHRPHLLTLGFTVTGDTSAIVVPPPTASARADGLWRHSCCEAFVRAPPETAYWEFNFSPSSQWAAYRFSGYRSGMTDEAAVGEPAIAQRCGGQTDWALTASLNLGRITGLAGEATWRLGLCAVIEEASGRRSYWALAHPPERPDFHLDGGFTLDVPYPEDR